MVVSVVVVIITVVVRCGCGVGCGGGCGGAAVAIVCANRSHTRLTLTQLQIFYHLKVISKN